MFVILATFQVDPAHLDAFLELIDTNAAASLADEPGCHRFDVCQTEGKPTEVVLYEIYDDPAAFDAHLETPHFAVFDQGVAPMVLAKEVKRLDLRPAR